MDLPVTVAIVQYRGGARLDRCVEAALAASGVKEVLIVDNEGTAGDQLRRRYADPAVRVIGMDGRAGYGRAANVSLAEAAAPAALLLNQDTVIPPDAPRLMLEAGFDSDAWVVGPRLVDGSGRAAPLKTRFPPPMRWSPPDGAGRGLYVPWVAGAAMLFMPAATGLRFDERLFFYAEDEELCWRVWASGGRVVVAATVEVMHEGGTAAAVKWTPGAITRRTVVNRARFVRWHLGTAALPAFVVGTARNRMSGPLSR